MKERVKLINYLDKHHKQYTDIIRMRGKRHSLSNEIMGIETPKKIVHKLDYDSIITKQQEVIKLLQKQITYLRQYLFYVADYEDMNQLPLNSVNSIVPTNSSKTIHSDKNAENNCQQNGNTPQKSVQKIESTSSTDPATKKISGLKGLIQQIMKILQAKAPDQIILKLKEMQQKANRKMEPIFVQRIKEKEVPVTVEVVKQVDRIIQVEKIVIQEKIVEKIVIQEKLVEVPVFKEKIIQKYISPDDSFEHTEHWKGNQIGAKRKNGAYEAKNLNQTTKNRYRQKDQSYSTQQYDRNDGYNHKNTGDRFKKRQNVNNRYVSKRY